MLSRMGKLRREAFLEEVRKNKSWDLIVIGGGATGLGCAVDAATRGLKTLLLEQADFAKGTSSRSTKLIHGGLRYLKQGNLTLVIEALHERGLLCKNAPHIVSHLGFLIPNYHWWEGPFYGIGVKIYDLLAGKLGLEKSIHLSKEETLSRFPTLEPQDLRGGSIYFDGQFDDARLACCLAQTAAGLGAVLLNYCPAVELLKVHGAVAGVLARDLETGETFRISSKAVINAGGVFSDGVRRLDDPKSAPLIAPSQGVHLVVDRSYLPADTAIIIPHTDDNRVLFFVPWHQHVLIGTTDTPVPEIQMEPKPLEEEISFLLKTTARYLTKPLQRENVLSAFAGLRPLIQSAGDSNTAALSRDHALFVSSTGLITITGGKWTTYRKMAQDAIDKAIQIGHLPSTPCRTHDLHLHGYEEGAHAVDAWACYGADQHFLKEIAAKNPELGRPLHPRLPYTAAEIVWAARQEMARTLEDVLARRTRSLFLDARAAMEIAPAAAHLLAQELGRPSSWETAQVEEFRALSRNYLI
jgi:glycerol-3-phosphate dehydrogenase